MSVTGVTTQHQVGYVEENGVGDDELSDLKEGDALSNRGGSPNFTGGKEIIRIHDGVNRKVQPNNPWIEGGAIGVGEDSVVEGGDMVVPGSRK